MVRAMLPHGPVEVAAYSLALALYLQGRSRPLPPRGWRARSQPASRCWRVAALLETFA